MEKNKTPKKWSIFISISIFILGITSIIMARALPAFDYWWHFKAGEYIVTNKTIPFIDVFSWYGIQEQLYWHSHEWLSEIFIYGFDMMFGKMGGYVFSLITTFVLVLTLFWFNEKKYYKNIKFSIIWIMLGIFILMPVITPRPHMISFILLSLTMYSLYSLKENENSKSIWFLPIISILWANFHGGSSNLPYVLCFIMLITGLFEFKIGRLVGSKLTKIQIKKLFIAGVLSILALIINPHGFDIVTYPYINMNDSFMLSIISEWRSPDLKQVSDIFIFIELFIIILPLLLNKDTDLEITDMAFIGSMVMLTFKSIRFSVLLYIITSFIIFKYIPKLKDKSALKQFATVLGFAGVILFGFLAMELPTIYNSPMKVIVSDKIIETIKQENPKRLYNDYDFGGYLIYNDIPVFVDGRADMYSGHNLKDAIDLSRLDKGAEEIIEKYDFDMFVLYSDTPLNYLLKNDNKYIKIIEDEGIVVYKTIKED